MRAATVSGARNASTKGQIRFLEELSVYLDSPTIVRGDW